jgi:hypothetical protein
LQTPTLNILSFPSTDPKSRQAIDGSPQNCLTEQKILPKCIARMTIATEHTTIFRHHRIHADGSSQNHLTEQEFPPKTITAATTASHGAYDAPTTATQTTIRRPPLILLSLPPF